MGLVGTMGMTGNMLLRSYRKGHGAFTDRKSPKKLAEDVMAELEVVTPSIAFPVRRLSGGNVQKVLVGREIAQEPSVLMTAYAVRGLDINTSYTIYNLLTEQKLKGVAVVYVGEDLDVLLELCDRILVLCGGQVSGIVDARTTTKEEVGLLMTFKKRGSMSTVKTHKDPLANCKRTASPVPRRMPSLGAVLLSLVERILSSLSQKLNPLEVYKPSQRAFGLRRAAGSPFGTP